MTLTMTAFKRNALRDRQNTARGAVKVKMHNVYGLHDTETVEGKER